MSRLIDADAYKKWLLENGYIFYDDGKWFRDLDAQPTIDAVEVVRCKDCVHNHGGEYCENDTYMKSDGYCHWGERKEDAETD